MVGGRTSLYIGVIMLDLGIVTATLTDVPHFIVMLYLIAIHAFSGIVEVLRALEAQRYKSSWRLKLSHGLLNIVIAIACIVFIRHMHIAVVVYCSGLIYSAAMRIITAHRTRRLAYIQ